MWQAVISLSVSSFNSDESIFATSFLPEAMNSPLHDRCLFSGIYASPVGLSSRVALANAAQVIFPRAGRKCRVRRKDRQLILAHVKRFAMRNGHVDRKSTRLNSSHSQISYAV